MRIDKPFTGIETVLSPEPAGTLRIFAIHGIGCHLPGWSLSLQEGIAENLGLHENTALRARIDLDVDQRRIEAWSTGSYLPVAPWRSGCADLSTSGAPAPDSPPTISMRVWEATNSSRVAFYEVVWSPVAEKAKFEELQDDYLSSSRGPRAVVNRWLKSSLVNERLADVSAYLGAGKESIQWVAQQALCWMSRDFETEPNVGSPLCQIDPGGIAHDPVIAITESLGSRIFFDTLWAPSLRIDELGLLSRLRTVFMLANQLPLLEVASGGQEASKAYASLSGDTPGTQFSAWLDAIEPGADCSIDMALASMDKDGECWEKDVEAKLDPRENAAEVRRCQAELDQATQALEEKDSEKKNLANRIAKEEESRQSLDQELGDVTRDLQALLDSELPSAQKELAEKKSQEESANEALQKARDQLRRNQHAQDSAGTDLENARTSARGLMDRLVQFSKAIDEVQSKVLADAEFAKPDDQHMARAKVALPAAWTHLDRAVAQVKQALDNDGGIQARFTEISEPSTRIAFEDLKLAGKGCGWFGCSEAHEKARDDLLTALDKLSYGGPPSETEIRALRASIDAALEKQRELQVAEADLVKTEGSRQAEWKTYDRARSLAEKANDEVVKRTEEARALEERLTRRIRSRDELLDRLSANLALQAREVQAQSARVNNLREELQRRKAKAEEKALAGIYAFKLTLRKSARAQLEARLRMVTSRLQAAEEGGGVLDRAQAQCLRPLRDRLDELVKSTQPQPKFVALSDPNDVLSYPVGIKLAEQYVTDFSNVILRLAPELAWIAGNPLRAHTGHESSPAAMQLITCGTQRTRKGKLVPGECRSGHHVDAATNSASTRSGITPASKPRSRRSWTARRPASP